MYPVSARMIVNALAPRSSSLRSLPGIRSPGIWNSCSAAIVALRRERLLVDVMLPSAATCTIVRGASFSWTRNAGIAPNLKSRSCAAIRLTVSVTAGSIMTLRTSASATESVSMTRSAVAASTRMCAPPRATKSYVRRPPTSRSATLRTGRAVSGIACSASLGLRTAAAASICVPPRLRIVGGGGNIITTPLTTQRITSAPRT